MSFVLPKLPFSPRSLEPFVSSETLEFHYGRHHKAYIEKLNRLVQDSRFREASIEDIIRQAEPGALFNNAAQAWNHTFFWNCLAPEKSGEMISSHLAKALKDSFGSIEKFQEDFASKALGLFGSGWAWLARDARGSLEIVCTENAGLPQRQNLSPLLTCDVWEHAYYIDYRNERKKYLDAFWGCVNWNFVSECFDEAEIDLNDQLQSGRVE